MANCENTPSSLAWRKPSAVTNPLICSWSDASVLLGSNNRLPSIWASPPKTRALRFLVESPCVSNCTTPRVLLSTGTPGMICKSLSCKVTLPCTDVFCKARTGTLSCILNSAIPVAWLFSNVWLSNSLSAERTTTPCISAKGPRACAFTVTSRSFTRGKVASILSHAS